MESTPRTPGSTWRGRRLVLHIGAGKTGTTAIQGALKADEEALAQRRVRYLGLMFERFGERCFDWQRPSMIHGFHALPVAEGARQFASVLRECLRASDLSATLVLSNESFLGQNAAVIRALGPFVEEGLDLAVVAYVRRHDQWAKSAFIQWGIRHKTYSGPQQSFGQWDNAVRNAFYPKLRPWLDAFGSRVLVRNYDAVSNVVTDFYSATGLGQKQDPVRRYQAPGASELALRALFNQVNPGKSSPQQFERLFGNPATLPATPLATWLGTLLPTDADLQRVTDEATADRDQVNAILARQGQPPLDTQAKPQRGIEVDPEAILMTLFQALVRQGGELERVKARLDRLEKSQSEAVPGAAEGGASRG